LFWHFQKLLAIDQSGMAAFPRTANEYGLVILGISHDHSHSGSMILDIGAPI
jgi:hypothetical protein